MATETKEKPVTSAPQQPASAGNGPQYTPAVDVVETNDALIFKADLPGVRQEDLNVAFDKGVLSVVGKVRPRGPSGSNYLWREYGIGDFSRSFIIQIPVKADEIRATLRQGELKLHVPKAESARTRQIPIVNA